MTRAPTPDAPRCGACKQALTRQRDGIYRCTHFLCPLAIGTEPRAIPKPKWLYRRTGGWKPDR